MLTISKRIIYYDQMGYIPGRQGWFNIPKSVGVIHHIDRLKMKKSHDHINKNHMISVNFDKL